MGKLNSHLRKHREHVKTIPLTYREIRATGSKASRMNGYSITDAVKIILGMDSVPDIEIKAQLLGPLGIFVKPDTSKEIHIYCF
ncbi:MAG: hypothetical protein BWK79_14720 [Beggiatoa sp. IS2]|nr:MAG: hypothetical protein BWK79_14720 [Beggiatoa sp. IS2]